MKKSGSRGGVKRKHPGNTSESENNKKKSKSAAACVECDVDTQDTRYNVVGCEDVPEFGEEVAKGEKVKVENAQPWIVRKAFHTLLKYPQSRAFLLECTELSPYANAIRFYTGLPVFRSIDRCVQHGPGFPDLAGRGANPYRSRIHLLKSFLLYIVFCSCSVSIPVAFFIFVQKFISPPR